MTSRMKMCLIGLALIAAAFPAFADTKACPKDGADGPMNLHKAWIMQGWERREGDAPYDFAGKLGKFYDLDDPKGVFWDNFAPGKSQLFHDSLVYGNNWKSLQDAARSVRHGLTDAGVAVVGRDVASTALGFVGRLERVSGDVIAFDARSQLGWKCVAGAWKIKQEMNYAWVVKPESVEPLLGKTK